MSADGAIVKKLHGAQLSRARYERKKEFEELSKQFLFVRDARPSADAIAADPLAPNVQRVLQWIKNSSWGRYSPHCVLEDGNLAFAADCARALKLNPGVVCRTMQFLETRGYIERRGISKTIVPKPDPKIGLGAAKLISGSRFKEFFENWKAANESAALEMETLGVAYERLRKAVLAEYRATLDNERKAATKTRGGIKLVRKPAEAAPAMPRPEPAIAPEIMRELEAAIPATAPFTHATAIKLVQIARQTAQGHGGTVCDAEIAGAIRDAAAAGDSRRIRHIGYFHKVLPDRIEALMVRRARYDRERELLAQKCLLCKGSGAHPNFPQEYCPDCGGSGLPKPHTKLP